MRVILIKDLARVHVSNLKPAQLLKRAPECGILTQRLLVEGSCFSPFHLPLKDLAE